MELSLEATLGQMPEAIKNMDYRNFLNQCQQSAHFEQTYDMEIIYVDKYGLIDEGMRIEAEEEQKAKDAKNAQG